MKKLYLYIWLMAALLSSCYMKREAMYHFTPEDSLCFNIYDTLKWYEFKTNNGIDSLIFYKKHVKENYNKWYFDQVEGSIFNAIFDCEGEFKHKGISEKVSFSYEKTEDRKDPLLRIIFLSRYPTNTNFLYIEDDRNFKSEGIYKDTIILDHSNSHINKYIDYPFPPEYLIWHKYKGIIGYKLSDGTVYPDSLNSN